MEKAGSGMSAFKDTSTMSLNRVASAVESDFCALCNTPEEDRQAVVSTVVEAVSGRTHVWLRYVE
ncbi:hypothetical protein ABCR88_17140 [Pseudomonas sp. W17]|uniref:Uncharacterized protein n=1 Tax=Pseudomonas sp. W17 TaxID=3144407 RepID=A0AAU7WPU4_9PSED